MNCAFDPQHGLANADRARLVDRLRTVRDGLIVTVTVHDSGNAELDDRWRSAVYQLLEFASSMACGQQIIVVFPDAEPYLLAPCLAAYNEESAEESERTLPGDRPQTANRRGAADPAHSGRCWAACSPRKTVPSPGPRPSAAGSRQAGSRQTCPSSSGVMST